MSDSDPGRSEGQAETPQEAILRELLTTLLTRTREGSLSWVVDDARADSYCLTGDGWMLASRSVDGDGVEPFAVLLTDAVGEPVLEVRSSRPYARGFRDKFGELHVAAAASAVISDAVPKLADVISELSGTDKPPV